MKENHGKEKLYTEQLQFMLSQDEGNRIYFESKISLKIIM